MKKPAINRPRSGNSGFTVIEIISVMLIIGIAAAVAAVRTGETSAESVSSRDQIKNHIRYAQIMALTENDVCGIRFNGDQYWLFRGDDAATGISLPGGLGPTFAIDPDLGDETSATIYFDLWGTPYTDSGLTSQWETASIGTLGISMQKDTGFVQ